MISLYVLSLQLAVDKYLSLVSQCSLHSCTSSEVNSVQEKAVGNDSSAASYTTSLSTDTLYWGELNGCEPQPTMTRQHSVKSNSSLPRESQAVKPKSWDNLTTKAFGGYGFGYGYVDRSQKSHGSKGSRRQTKYVVQPTKSSESLLLLPEYPQLNDSSLSCECLDATSPSPVPSEKMRFYTMPAEPFYHRDKASQTERRQYVNVSQTPEITRL
ncbi:unnamed protein product [Nesidiocoris tenuis]|uniref:Uncharacterized protein n=1 Tax=Nesidiocoris tenuis TaxID=355587 RepID=A0A6H5G274_9HEMI|nr:unnamed protein product [Nesidiocoris tenuis]